jgi:hypothetical protein
MIMANWNKLRVDETSTSFVLKCMSVVSMHHNYGLKSLDTEPVSEMFQFTSSLWDCRLALKQALPL